MPRTRSSRKSQSPIVEPEQMNKGLRPVKLPLSTTPLNRLIYILLLVTAIIGAYYSYRLVQYKTEVGGWWDMAIGKKPPPTFSSGQVKRKNGPSGGVGDSVIASKINELAKMLGMPDRELASAVLIAARNYVPPDSFSSAVPAEETARVSFKEQVMDDLDRFIGTDDEP